MIFHCKGWPLPSSVSHWLCVCPPWRISHVAFLNSSVRLFFSVAVQFLVENKETTKVWLCAGLGCFVLFCPLALCLSRRLCLRGLSSSDHPRFNLFLHSSHFWSMFMRVETMMCLTTAWMLRKDFLSVCGFLSHRSSRSHCFGLRLLWSLFSAGIVW